MNGCGFDSSAATMSGSFYKVYGARPIAFGGFTATSLAENARTWRFVYPSTRRRWIRGGNSHEHDLESLARLQGGPSGRNDLLHAAGPVRGRRARRALSGRPPRDCSRDDAVALL